MAKGNAGGKDQGELKATLAMVADAVMGAAVLTALGAWAGSWLVNRYHLSPWVAIACPVAGMCLGLTRMVMKALSMNTESGPPSGGSGYKQPLDDWDRDD